jgi:photosystem II stability/assembly factor-like uncharacterized protein
MSYLSSRSDRDMLIAGVALQGLFASADGASTWTKLGQGAGSTAVMNRPREIVYDPEHPDTFWEAGIYEGACAYRTTDNGATFVALGSIRHCDGFAVDFSDPQRKLLLAGGHEQANTIYRSLDGGMTWNNIGGPLPAGSGFSFPGHIVNAQTYLAGTWTGNGGVFRTTDGGMSWSRVYMGGVFRTMRAADRNLYWLLEGDRGIIRSTDEGATWTNGGGAGAIKGAASLTELPDGRLVAIGGQSLLVSTDHAATWRAFGPALPNSPNGVLYSRFRKALYVWRSSCAGPNDPVPADAVMRLDFDYQKP